MISSGCCAPGCPARMTSLSIPELIADRAGRTPAHTAVDDGVERLNLAELERRSDAVAAAMRRRGVEPGTFVATCVQRDAGMVALLLGILKAGGAYVALDPAYPEARLRWILDDISPGLIVASPELRAAVPDAGIPVVTSNDLNAHDGRSSVRPKSLPEDPNRLAFITYTSGTTGRPKGVMHAHGSAVYLMGVVNDYLAIGPGARFLQFYPLTWEIQILDVFAVLAAGGTVVIPPVGLDATGPELVRFLRDARVTHAMLPPALLAELVEDPPLPDLRTLAYIGEVCLPQVAERWGRGRRLVNLYGPTEVTVAATASDERGPGEAPPIGRPLPGRRVYLLDDRLRSLPDGEPGELCVGGRGLARGYWRLPELTARHFPPDPFAGDPAARMYRTGDRARRRPDGNLEFLGRVDGQLSLRGQRVERGEVEAVMTAHPGVRSCAVTVQGGGPHGRLIAFVVGVPGVAAQLPELLAAQLPPIMVPSAVVQLDGLPLNEHGKVDLKALAVHPVPSARSRDDDVAPLTGPQAALAAVWEQVLGVSHIAVTDGFRALGGTSLQAVRELVSAPTLADVTALIAAAPRAAAGLPPLLRQEVAASHEASPHQRRLWMLARMRRAASVAYNEVSALRLTGRLDRAALGCAVRDIADRHEAFRSSFRLDGTALRVDVVEHVTVELQVEASVAPELRAAELGAVPFDLSRAPLLRATLLEVSDQEHVLVLVTHHTVADGPSLDVVDADLARCYAARLAGRAPDSLPQYRLRPRDHAVWHAANVDHPALTAGLRRWRDLLDGAPTDIQLPAARPRPAVFSHRGERLQSSTGAELRSAVTRLARDAGTTPYAVCLLALAVLVARHSGRRDVLIGSPYAGRPDADADAVVGFFTNTVAMRVTFDDSPEPLRMLAAVEPYAQEALQHQYVDFADVVRAVGARPGASGQPLVQVVLAYQGPIRPNAGLTGLRVEPLLIDNGTVKADLTVEINETAGDLVVVLPYSTDVLTRSAAQRMLTEYVEILRSLSRAPHEPIALGRAERLVGIGKER